MVSDRPDDRGFRPIVHEAPLTLGEHRRWPGSRILLTCAMCGWARTYAPERLIDRLRQLKAGGYATPIGPLARRVAWPCPMCGRVKWRMDLAQPTGLSPREARRLSGRYRN